MVRYIGLENEHTVFYLQTEGGPLKSLAALGLFLGGPLAPEDVNLFLADLTKPRKMDDKLHKPSNIWLANGGRFYKDGHIVEYATPECITPRELVLTEMVGDEIVARSANMLAGKENVYALKRSAAPQMGASWGAHENYAIPESLHRELISNATLSHDIFKSFSASRQAVAGAGHLGYLTRGDNSHIMFWISPRMYFIGSELDQGTRSGSRALVNSREESLMDGNLAGLRRLHMIVGDVNRSPWSVYLKVGTTILVLEFLQLAGYGALDKLFAKMKTGNVLLDRAKAATLFLSEKRLSQDFKFLLDIQYRLSDAVWAKREEIAERHGEFEEIFGLWREALDAVAGEGEARKKYEKRLDWLVKKKLFEDVMGGEIADLEKIGRGKKLRKLLLLDFAYHRVNHKDLYKALLQSGAIEEKYGWDEAKDYLAHPPEGRAKKRVELVRYAQKLGIVDNIISFDWKLAGFTRPQSPQSVYDRSEPKYLNIIFDDRPLVDLKLQLDDICHWLWGG